VSWVEDGVVRTSKAIPRRGRPTTAALAVAAAATFAAACGADRATSSRGDLPRVRAGVDAGSVGATDAATPAVDASVRVAENAPRWVLPDAATRPTKARELAARIERVLDDEHDRGRTGASFSFALVVDGVTVLDKARGVADLDAKVVATPETIYRVASITKTFTTAAILSLRDRGVLRLDDAVARHLTELGDASYPTRDAAPLSIAQILTHAGGLPRSGAYAALDRPSTEDDLAEAMRAPLDLDPGVTYRYSNLGFGLLGLLVARKTGAPYRDWVKGHLLEPLEMRSSGFDVATLPAARLAVGYVRDATGKLTRRPMTSNGVGEGAGGLFSTSGDMARWIAFQLAAWPPRDDDDAGPVRRASLREAHLPRHVHEVTTAEGRVEGTYARRVEAKAIGLGWHVTSGCYFDRLVGHDGDLDGFHARLRFDPSRGVGFVLLTSSDAAQATPIAERVLDTIALHDALAPYERAPSAELSRAVERAMGAMGGAWTDAQHAETFAESLRAVLSAADVRRLAVERARAVGSCKPARTLGASGALDGAYEYACARGRLRVTARGTGSPLRLQTFSITTVTPPSDDDRKVARAVTTSMARRADAELAASLGVRDAAAIGARLRGEGASAGPCRVGDGETTGKTTTFALTCARRSGALRLVTGASGVRPELDLTARCVR
jgi:CubicO group peptidase (beta-lactamase class C family)